MLQLDQHVLELVLRHLTVPDLMKLRGLARALRAAVDAAEGVWEARYRNRAFKWSKRDRQSAAGLSWSERFKKRYMQHVQVLRGTTQRLDGEVEWALKERSAAAKRLRSLERELQDLERKLEIKQAAQHSGWQPHEVQRYFNRAGRALPDDCGSKLLYLTSDVKSAKDAVYGANEWLRELQQTQSKEEAKLCKLQTALCNAC